MPRPQHVCADCPTLCRGLRCSPCAHKFGMRNYRPIMPNQPSVGEHLGVPKALLPQSSWWAEPYPCRAEFFAEASRQFFARMSKSGGTNYQPRELGWV